MNTTARVIQSTGSWYRIMKEDRTVLDARLPGKFRMKDIKETNPIAVGDIVNFSVNDDGTAVIDEIKERQNKITRRATHGRKGEHVLVANVDQGFVVQSVNEPKLRTGFIDRFLVTAEAFSVDPLVIVNKIDLGREEDAEEIAHVMDLYESLGYGILLTSIYDDASIEELRNIMKEKTSVFIGPSGVGKTSLLNSIEPGIDRPIGEISKFSNKGKHTTTFAELIPLSFGGFLADTPGIREFGLIHFEAWEISLFFPEMKDVQQECRYYNCTHIHEPGCAVMEAYKDGHIAASRYDSYINMVESLEDEQKSTGSRKRG